MSSGRLVAGRAPPILCRAAALLKHGYLMDRREFINEHILARYRKDMPALFDVAFKSFLEKGWTEKQTIQGFRDHMMSLMRPIFEQGGNDLAETCTPLFRIVLNEWLAEKESNHENRS